MDICGTVSINGASFVSRTTSFDKSLPQLITKAIENDGFSLLDIWELCTAYYVADNKFSRKKLEESMETCGFPRGVLRNYPRPEYSSAYRGILAGQVGEPAVQARDIKPRSHAVRLMGHSAGRISCDGPHWIFYLRDNPQPRGDPIHWH